MTSESSSSLKRPSSEMEPPVHEPSAKRTTDTTLETVANRLNDDTHLDMDKAVLRAMAGDTSSLLLLNTIVTVSNGLLDPKYMNILAARALLNDHPELEEKLSTALKTSSKSFAEIRNLKILRANDREVAFAVPIEQKDAVVNAWNMEYRGDAYKVLLHAVDDVQNQDLNTQYDKIVPVVQSSGTGKSRTVDKIAEERIVIPLCLREDLGVNYFAYPPTDAAVRGHLLGAPDTGNERLCKSYMRSFLSSLFTSTRLQADKFCRTRADVSYATMAKKFYNFFKNVSQRKTFYESVIENAINPRVSSPNVSSEDVGDSLKRLLVSLKQLCNDWPTPSCPLILSIDEVHLLFNQRGKDTLSNYTLFSRLKSVLSELRMEAFCVIILSTATSISKRVPSNDIAPSMRARDDGLDLPAPFTDLPFDAHIISEPLVPGKATLRSVGSLEFTAKFGRPLFYATFLSRKATRDYSANIVVGMMLNLREKLCGRRWHPQSRADLDASSIAVLSARFLLDLSPAASDARHYEEELVRRHLRMLYSVPQNRQAIITGSSPEPLIAEASAQIMHHRIGNKGNQEPYMDIWRLLALFVDRGLAAQGTVGELIGRVLSILAMDNAIDELSTVCELKYQTPVTVADYYKAFLTDEAWETLRQSTPANCSQLSEESAGKTFELAFTSAYFHFSHYAKANDAIPMQDSYAWANWLRGTAVLCQPNEELNRATPIYFSNLGNVSPQSMSVALDQDKTGQSVDPQDVAVQSARKLHIFKDGSLRPYIAAVHCYALTKDEGIAVTTPPPYDLKHPATDQEAPRYQIDFRGLSAYGNLSDATKVGIRRMINGSMNAVFLQHPRSYGVPLLRRMLPLLTGDSDSTAWFGSPSLEGPGSVGSGKGKGKATA